MASALPVDVVVLALPQVSPSLVFGMSDLFWSAGRDWDYLQNGTPGPTLVRPRIVAASRAPLAISNGVRIVPDAAFDDVQAPAIVCVPDLFVPRDAPLTGQFERELAFLRRCHAAEATLAAACSGALLLAEAGLLDGYEATTHWAYCDILQRRYPRVKVHGERALVVTGEGQRLVMAGGGTSWLDLALYLIARFVSVEEAMRVARVNLIDWHDIGQQPFARLACSRQVDDATIAQSQVWIADHYATPAPVAAMAKVAALPERSFKRRFRLATGMAPLEYVHTLRLEEAKHMLETTDDPVEAIANAVGYEDAAFFGRLFRRKVALTPGQYRKRFGALRQALVATDRHGVVAGREHPLSRARGMGRSAAAGTGGDRP